MLSLKEAAEQVGLSPGRLRLLAESGRLQAQKIGRDWLVDPESLEGLRKEKLRGRPLSDANAWGLLALLSGDRAVGVDRHHRQRVEHLLAEPARALGLIEKSQSRAVVRRFWLPPEDLPRLAEEPGLVRSGLSALSASDFDLFYFEPVFDAYLDEARLPSVIKRFQPLEAAPNSNVWLRVPSQRWVLGQGPQAPAPVVAADLLSNRDERVRAAGRAYLIREMALRG